MSGNDHYQYEEGHFAEMIHDQFSGATYENEHTATSDGAFRFETIETKIRGAVVLVSDNDVLIGDSSNQRYPRDEDTALSMHDVELSTLYFKNATAGNNTKINIIGVRI